MIRANLQRDTEYKRLLREEYGVHVQHVAPVLWQGRRLWAIGSRVYLDRRPNETYHEFLFVVLRDTLGEEWWTAQTDMPEDEQHYVFTCFQQLRRFKEQHFDAEQVARAGHVSAELNGWVRYLLSLAWDVATLIHAGEPPDELIERLRDRHEYQGARYELAVAAIFARLDCSIRWLDTDLALRSVKRVEFEATHRPTGQTFAVEAKSRRRAGVLHEPGEPDADEPLRRDARMVRRLFVKATEKAPEGMPFFVFIDINAPRTADDEWQSDVQRWMNRIPAPSPEQPDVFNAVYITNFSPQYDRDEPSDGGRWLATISQRPRVAMEHDIESALMPALNTYGRVPPFSEGNRLLDE